MKKLFIFLQLLTIGVYNSNQVEKYSFSILFEKTKKEYLLNETSFLIPPNNTSWNLSFWSKIDKVGTSVPLLSIANQYVTLNLQIDILNKLISFNSLKICNYFQSTDFSDFQDLSAISNTWFFISINYNLKKFQIYSESVIQDFPITNEFLSPQNSKIIFQNSNVVSYSLYFAHVHFFNFNIPVEDFEEIRFYPKNILAIYKFSYLKPNNQIIINLVDDKNFKNLQIINQNRIPFKNQNSFVKVKINFPFYNRSIVIKNLIISINSNIFFRNFIKNLSSYQNINWIISWYSRISEKTLNNFTVQTQLSYSTITIDNHIVNFRSKISENNLSPDFTLNSTVHNLRIGDWTRDDYNLDVLTIIQIRDIPQPNNQSRLRQFNCNIPVLNYSESLNYNFDLSYYDKHYFKIENDSNSTTLMYLVLNEILVYTGDNIEKDLVEKRIYLGKQKRILVKCRDSHDLLRVYPDNNKNVIIDRCINNELDDLKCPFIPNCLFCYPGNCIICKEGYVNYKFGCKQCEFPKIIVRNVCMTGSIKFNRINDMALLETEYLNSKLIAINFKLESLKNFSDSDWNSKTNKFHVTQFYFLNGNNFENPNNFLKLINLDDFVVQEIYFLALTEKTEIIHTLDHPYGCSTTNTIFYYNDPLNNFLGICVNFCVDIIYTYQGFCNENIYDCLDISKNDNRCQICKMDFINIFFGIGITKMDLFYCIPQKIQTETLFEIQNNFIFLNEILCSNNCSLCSISGNTCFLCNPFFELILINATCIPVIRNCVSFDLYGNCVDCRLGFTLITGLGKCILNSSVIENCVLYNEDQNELCNSCNKDFFLNKLSDPLQCVLLDMKTDFCKIYSKEPNFKCTKCIDDYFIFETQEAFNISNICIPSNYLTFKCINYNQFNLLCDECQLGFELINLIPDLLLCIESEKIIKNCFFYNIDLECEEYLTKYNPLIKDNMICLCGETLVNSKCVENCSPAALNCEDCEQTCPLYLCFKLIPFCIECDTSDYMICKKCEKDFELKNGNCIRTKYLSYFNNIKLCVEGCSECYDKICLRCLFDYELDPINRICIKNFKIIQNVYNHFANICKRKENFSCMINGELLFQQCFECQRICNCSINYINQNAFLTCENDTVIFTLKNDNKFLYFLKEVDMSIESRHSLKFTFKNKNQKDVMISFPRFLIRKATNCTFDNFRFYQIKNLQYIPKITKPAALNIFTSKICILPVLTNLIPKTFGYLLAFFQMQEIMTYLYLLNFNGGNIYEFLSNIDLNLYKFGDLNSEQNEFQKQFVFIIDHFDYFNFIQFPDIFMLAFFILREFCIMIFILGRTIHYYRLDEEVCPQEYFKENLVSMKRRTRNFVNSFFMMLAIKNFSKSKRLFAFHGIFPNIFIELLFIFFHFFIIFFSLNYLRNIYRFIKQDSDFEDVDYEDENDYAILTKLDYREEDIILNRISVYTYLVFFLRTFIIQNYSENIILANVVVFLSYFIFIIYLIIRVIKGKRVKIYISIFLFNEVIFFVYFILGQYFLVNFINLLVLDIFYVICYFGKIVENIYSIIFNYFVNKVDKVIVKPTTRKKSFHFPPELLVRYDVTNPYVKKHYPNFK